MEQVKEIRKILDDKLWNNDINIVDIIMKYKTEMEIVEDMENCDKHSITNKNILKEISWIFYSYNDESNYRDYLRRIKRSKERKREHQWMECWRHHLDDVNKKLDCLIKRND